MKKNCPTIYDVARYAGVSISTVSRVLNSPEKVNDVTRTNVLIAIDALGFVPKAEARARALRSSGRVGVITPYFTTAAFVQRLRGIASLLTKSKYEMVIFPVDLQEQLQQHIETIALTHDLDGLILVSVQIGPDVAQRLLHNRVATVLIEYPLPDFSSVEIDDQFGGRLAANCLVNKGHRSFAFVGEIHFPEFGATPICARLAGFRSVLQEQGIAFNDDMVWDSPFDVEATCDLVVNKWKSGFRPTAIFCGTDHQAVGVLKAAHQLGLLVPEDLAVIGFDDLDIADYMGLSTIRQQLDESGKVAAEMVFSRIADPGRPIQHIRFPLTLVERRTT